MISPLVTTRIVRENKLKEILKLYLLLLALPRSLPKNFELSSEKIEVVKTSSTIVRVNIGMMNDIIELIIVIENKDIHKHKPFGHLYYFLLNCHALHNVYHIMTLMW